MNAMQITQVPFGNILMGSTKNGLNKPKSVRGTGVKMISMGEIFAQDQITDVPMDRVPVTETEFLNSNIEENDLLFARQSLTLAGAGKCSIVREVAEPTVFESHLIRTRVDTKIADPWYVYYYFHSPVGKHNVESIVEQVSAAGIRGKDLVKLFIPLPDLNAQKRIVKTLKTIDDKILKNEEINKNLQHQADAIYSDLYFGHSDSSWKMGTLSELIEVAYGKDHKQQPDGPYPVYGSGGVMRHVAKPLYTGESVLIPRKGTLNNVMYVNGPFWSVDTMFYTKMKKNHVAKFVFHFVKSKDLAAMNTGSAVPSMTKDLLNAMQLVIPSDAWFQNFDDELIPLYSQIDHCEKENRALSGLRDSLLPRLMSGELDVSNVEI